MKKLSFRVFSDGAFTLFTSFCVSFVLLSFFIKMPYSIIIAASLALIISVLAVKRIANKTFNSGLKKEDEKKMNETIGELNIMTKQKIVSLFSKAFGKKGLFVKRRSGGLYSPKEKTLYLFHFGFIVLSKNDVVNAVNKLSNGEKTVIYTHEIKDGVSEFAVRFNGKAEILGEKEVYALLKETDCIPEPTFTPVGSRHFKDAALKAFSKKRAPKFFGLGLLFLFCSFFVPFRIYYAVFGSALLIVSLICVLVPERKSE